MKEQSVLLYILFRIEFAFSQVGNHLLNFGIALLLNVKPRFMLRYMQYRYRVSAKKIYVAKKGCLTIDDLVVKILKVCPPTSDPGENFPLIHGSFDSIAICNVGEFNADQVNPKVF